ncbi:hypothetical protein C8J57DRAFT_1491935 [Mycena rebaudengoi]|nr:hypothetical protein C8J57DRAFT_1491935 [Mycena rebaudengoi]
MSTAISSPPVSQSSSPVATLDESISLLPCSSLNNVSTSEASSSLSSSECTTMTPSLSIKPKTLPANITASFPSIPSSTFFSFSVKITPAVSKESLKKSLISDTSDVKYPVYTYPAGPSSPIFMTTAQSNMASAIVELPTSSSLSTTRVATAGVIHSRSNAKAESGSSPMSSTADKANAFKATSPSSTPSTVSETPVDLTAIFGGGGTSTSETSGTSTSSSRPRSFAQNTGGIVGVTFAAIIALVFGIVLTILLCRRSRRAQGNVFSGPRGPSLLAADNGIVDSYSPVAKRRPRERILSSRPPSGVVEVPPVVANSPVAQHYTDGWDILPSPAAAAQPPMSSQGSFLSVGLSPSNALSGLDPFHSEQGVRIMSITSSQAAFVANNPALPWIHRTRLAPTHP